MEYVIAVFVGLWIAIAGALSYRRICKDFNNHEKGEKMP